MEVDQAVQSGVALQSESIGDVWDEALPLVQAAQQEVGTFPPEAFQPDRKFFEWLDSQGYLYICERGENKIRRVKLW